MLFVLSQLATAWGSSIECRRFSDDDGTIIAPKIGGLLDNSRGIPLQKLAGLYPGSNLISQFLGTDEVFRLVMAHIISTNAVSVCFWPLCPTTGSHIRMSEAFARSLMSQIPDIAILLEPLPVLFLHFGSEFRLSCDARMAVKAVKELMLENRSLAFANGESIINRASMVCEFRKHVIMRICILLAILSIVPVIKSITRSN